MKKHFYVGLIIFAVLLLALGRLIVRPPAAVLGMRAKRPGKAPNGPPFSPGLSTRF